MRRVVPDALVLPDLAAHLAWRPGTASISSSLAALCVANLTKRIWISTDPKWVNNRADLRAEGAASHGVEHFGEQMSKYAVYCQYSQKDTAKQYIRGQGVVLSLLLVRSSEERLKQETSAVSEGALRLHMTLIFYSKPRPGS